MFRIDHPDNPTKNPDGTAAARVFLLTEPREVNMINARTIHFPFDGDDLQTAVAYDASKRPEYVGRAPAGVATSVAQWQIRKIAYNADSQVVSVKFAAGANDYNQIWDNRSLLTYA